MTIAIAGIKPRNDRNGARVAAWKRRQNYNIDLAASDPTTALATLWDIAQHGSGAQVAKVASNPATPTDLLRYIFQDHTTFEINKRLATNPRTPVDVMWELYNDSFAAGALWERLAKNPATPQDLLEAMLPYEFQQHRGTLLPGLATTARWKWSRTWDTTRYTNIFKHPNHPGLDAFFKSALFINMNWVYEYYRKHEVAAVAYLNSTHGLQLQVGAHPMTLFRVAHRFYEV